ncbi:MAG: Mth938-like domain-containing protein [Alphaproteobacteria bacterium]
MQFDEQSPLDGLIEGYGADGFRVAGRVHKGAVLLLPERSIPWDVSGVGDITLESLSEVTGNSDGIDILLIGCGPTVQMIPSALRKKLRDEFSISVDFMDTGAACRTYNVLRMDERLVAAALLPT